MPWGDSKYISNNFVAHLERRHKCDYDVLADYEITEEESMKRALQASAEASGFGGSDEDAILALILEESAREAGIGRTGAEDDMLAQALQESAKDVLP